MLKRPKNCLAPFNSMPFTGVLDSAACYAQVFHVATVDFTDDISNFGKIEDNPSFGAPRRLLLLGSVVVMRDVEQRSRYPLSFENILSVKTQEFWVGGETRLARGASHSVRARSPLSE
jgi:hypothetical protein